MDYKNTFKGGCHCGNVSLALHTNRDESEFTPRICQCSYCRSHGASWISDPEGTAHLQYKNQEDVNSYTFGHQTASFVVCAKCGVLTIATCELEGNTRAVLNITAMVDQKFTAAPIMTNFDGEDVESRLARRTQNWTGNVVMSGG